MVSEMDGSGPARAPRKKNKNRSPFRRLGKTRRTANARERQRIAKMADGFSSLRNCLPVESEEVSTLSRKAVLDEAIWYIEEMKRMLEDATSNDKDQVADAVARPSPSAQRFAEAQNLRSHLIEARKERRRMRRQARSALRKSEASAASNTQTLSLASDEDHRNYRTTPVMATSDIANYTSSDLTLSPGSRSVRTSNSDLRETLLPSTAMPRNQISLPQDRARQSMTLEDSSLLDAVAADSLADCAVSQALGLDLVTSGSSRSAVLNPLDYSPRCHWTTCAGSLAIHAPPATSSWPTTAPFPIPVSTPSGTQIWATNTPLLGTPGSDANFPTVSHMARCSRHTSLSSNGTVSSLQSAPHQINSASSNQGGAIIRQDMRSPMLLDMVLSENHDKMLHPQVPVHPVQTLPTPSPHTSLSFLDDFIS